jgi:16S rRNA (guanine527-N7)-methyltransferase
MMIPGAPALPPAEGAEEQETNNQETNTNNSGVQWRIGHWFRGLSAEVLQRLETYNTELLRFNPKLNLVSPKSLLEADREHFADSMLAWRAIASTPFKAKTIYDMGSGNGFPGLVFAILSPPHDFVLVERDGRKAEFLKHMIVTLGLKNARVHVGAMEDLPDGSVEMAVSRGFAPLSRSLLAARKVFVKDGQFFHLKGRNWVSELTDLPAQVCALWRTNLLADYKLPVTEAAEDLLSVILTRKLS